jgi:hypothetical protein
MWGDGLPMSNADNKPLAGRVYCQFCIAPMRPAHGSPEATECTRVAQIGCPVHATYCRTYALVAHAIRA